jgi:hypothetical protein
MSRWRAFQVNMADVAHGKTWRRLEFALLGQGAPDRQERRQESVRRRPATL